MNLILGNRISSLFRNRRLTALSAMFVALAGTPIAPNANAAEY
jgi:hypothetical protein